MRHEALLEVEVHQRRRKVAREHLCPSRSPDPIQPKTRSPPSRSGSSRPQQTNPWKGAASAGLSSASQHPHAFAADTSPAEVKLLHARHRAQQPRDGSRPPLPQQRLRQIDDRVQAQHLRQGLAHGLAHKNTLRGPHEHDQAILESE
eukprot:CAMPEP_0206277590 /NCGR_PEP_ID=MMETSP0047_2-20121206/36945_1 /ASSEMBLY_ACC=CAM_ASM_000192 /TAXON_ID=195065 /ORGANISM="Chroomonas mesostigmatica_cf, Strain CCMP1168" /LENGTH=146 /DNA_ID=CAMNT_0053707233 /DNA_START=644 /DNA_END=1084 /DNA_ORIENTATION=-